MDHPTLTSRHVTASHCAHLRHKGMYVGPPEVRDEEKAVLPLYRDWLEATAYWCVCTQKNYGPDGHPVSAEACRSGRECCEH
jgi:hypothetical protein